MKKETYNLKTIDEDFVTHLSIMGRIGRRTREYNTWTTL